MTAGPFEPRPGDVIRYDYLWRRQALEGRTTGDKDRPACIILTAVEDGRVKRVMILPVTHSQPKQTEPAYKMPATLKRHLGLDDEESWIVLGEANIDIWPSPDCLPVPGRNRGFRYGRLPQRLTEQLRRIVMAVVLGRSFDLIDREAGDAASGADPIAVLDTWKPPSP